MNRTGLLYDDRYLLHRTGPDHPEVPERLQAIHEGLEKGEFFRKRKEAAPVETYISRRQIKLPFTS